MMNCVGYALKPVGKKILDFLNMQKIEVDTNFDESQEDWCEVQANIK